MRAANQAPLGIATMARTFRSLRALDSRFRLLRKLARFRSLRELALRFRLLRKLALKFRSLRELAPYYAWRRPRRGTGNPVVPNLSSAGCILLGALGSKLAIAVLKVSDVIEVHGEIERSPTAVRGAADSFKGAGVVAVYSGIFQLASVVTLAALS